MRGILFICSLAAAFIMIGCAENANVEADNDDTTVSTTGSGAGDSGNSTIGGSGSSSDNGIAGESGDGSGLKSVYFRFDKFDVEGEDNINAIKDNAALISNNASYEVRVEGNTDEWGSDEYNYALALKRASSVKDALISENIPAEKIKLVSYGESKPKCSEKTKECWKENRRVDFVLIPQQ